MKDYFKFGEIDSRDFNIWLFDMNTDGGADIEREKVSVPGRDGDLLMSTSRLSNRVHRYMGVIYEDFELNLDAFRDAMAAKRGYDTLTDSIHPNEIYKAIYKAPLDPKVAPGRKMGKFAIEFDRKPQRWLAGGQVPFEVSSGGSLVNPTAQNAQPLIRVYGTGTLTVGADTITVSSHSNSYIDIDSEVMDCYCGTTNCNSYVTFASHEFPLLPAGETGITFSGFTKVEVTPRWWRA